ncbi:MAG TPA: EAL domain-containing protein [Gammaproteobacteria bacterium]|nr:EAL domain-containing protein [Gammaproteobacteria bacterium]
MTLNRQISTGIVLILIAGFIATVAISTQNLRTFMTAQLETHARDTATSLGLSLSPYVQPPDMPVISAMIGAVFDRGEYQRITLTSADGDTLVEKSVPPDTGAAPEWFVKAITLHAPAMEALVMSGWNQAGRIHVTSNTGRAYNQLWSTTMDTLMLYLIAAAITLALATVAVRFLLRPLARVKLQADAIRNRSYMVQRRLPRTAELRSVVLAMNRLSEKVGEIFTEQSALTERLREQAYQDTVTGLGNRRYFDCQFGAMLDARDEVSQGALLLLELRDLSRVNERTGYTAGDMLLKRTGELIKSQLAYLENSFATRISGAGFGIVATGLPTGSADALAATLCRDLLQLRADGLADSNNIGHIGIAMWRHGNTLPELLSEADMALRSAQASGQNTWQRYQAPAANQPEIHSMENWRKRLREVIDKGAIRLYVQAVYQPAAQGNSLLHKEVLARIDDNSKNGVNAGIFVPLAERFGLASQLDKLAVTRLLEYLAQNPDPSTLFAVNLSSTSLHDAVFIQWLATTLGNAPTLAKRILVEFPEYAVLANIQNAHDLVERLNTLGCRSGIDHFGKGFASFGYLRSMDISYVKIDSSYIRGIDSNVDNRFFVQALTDTLHSLDILVIAQAVETAAERDTLAGLNIDGLQGHLTGRPDLAQASASASLGR